MVSFIIQIAFFIGEKREIQKRGQQLTLEDNSARALEFFLFGTG